MILDIWSNDWIQYIGALEESLVRIKDRTNEIIWVASPQGCYTPKDGYNFLIKDKNRLWLNGDGEPSRKSRHLLNPGCSCGAYYQIKYLLMITLIADLYTTHLDATYKRNMLKTLTISSYIAQQPNRCGIRFISPLISPSDGMGNNSP